jgi:hypothetical protein
MGVSCGSGDDIARAGGSRFGGSQFKVQSFGTANCERGRRDTPVNERPLSQGNGMGTPQMFALASCEHSSGHPAGHAKTASRGGDGEIRKYHHNFTSCFALPLDFGDIDQPNGRHEVSIAA